MTALCGVQEAAQGQRLCLPTSPRRPPGALEHGIPIRVAIASLLRDSNVL